MPRITYIEANEAIDIGEFKEKGLSSESLSIKSDSISRLNFDILKKLKLTERRLIPTKSNSYIKSKYN